VKSRLILALAGVCAIALAVALAIAPSASQTQRASAAVHGLSLHGLSKSQKRHLSGSNQNTGLPLTDKPYMTIDNNPNSPFRDRIYVTWTQYATDGTAYIYEVHSNDYGQTFSSPVVVSTTSSLCSNTGGLPTPQGTCNNNQYSDPFTGSNGALYVAFANFNNTVTGKDNRNQVLLAKSTNGGQSFSPPVKVADYYELPDCAAAQGGADPFRACVPEKGAAQNSVFRASNYPSGGVNPRNPNQVVVTVASYINRDSNEGNGCVPNGLNPATGGNLYTGVKTPGACNNSQFFGDYSGVSALSGAHPLWSDTRNPDAFLCPGTAAPGVPPALCTGTEPSGILANDQQIYTRMTPAS
jgi:hypothetical protein